MANRNEFSISEDGAITGQIIGSMRKFGHRIGSDLEKDPILTGGALNFDEETGKCLGMDTPHHKMVELWQDGNLVRGRGVLVED